MQYLAGLIAYSFLSMGTIGLTALLIMKGGEAFGIESSVLSKIAGGFALVSMLASGFFVRSAANHNVAGAGFWEASRRAVKELTFGIRMLFS